MSVFIKEKKQARKESELDCPLHVLFLKCRMEILLPGIRLKAELVLKSECTVTEMSLFPVIMESKLGITV